MKRQWIVTFSALLLGAFSGSAHAILIKISPVFTNGTDLQKSVFNQAIVDWVSVMSAPLGKAVTLTVTTTFMDLGIDQGGSTGGFVPDANKLPKSVTLLLSDNSVMFYDATPGTADDIPADKKDALSVARHELGHALGFGVPWDLFKACVDMAKATFGCKGAFATLAGNRDDNELSHLDAAAHPGDLMNLTVGLGNRRAISYLDIKMLEAAFGYVPEPTSLALLGLGLAGLGLSRRRRAA